MEGKDIAFISGYFNLSTQEAINWIHAHTQEDIDTIFNMYMEEVPPLEGVEEL